jgi:diguanylate cyclase
MDTTAFPNFDTAARTALAFLRERLGLDLWMITDAQGESVIVLQTEGRRYRVAAGNVFPWAGPSHAWDAAGQVMGSATPSREVYARGEAPKRLHVESADSRRLAPTDGGGGRYGRLGVMDPGIGPEGVSQELELIEVIGGLLSALLAAEVQYADQSRRAEQAWTEALSDPLTGLVNRRGWTQLLEAEEERCCRYGLTAAVICLDLDDLKAVNDSRGHFAGDELIARTGTVLRAVARTSDVAARIGGDEFALLAVECQEAASLVVLERLQTALDGAKVKASLGLSLRDPTRGLHHAWEQADSAMYRNKRRMRA